MCESSDTFELGVFKDAILDEDVSVQVDAIKRLPILASAIDVEKTRDELIPCLANSVDAMPEESCFNLAEQLERLVPLVGGSDHVGVLLDILVKLACEDEVLVRERAIESMRNICDSLEQEQCEKSFYPLIENMISSDWFTTKCSAGCLISICYAKISPDKQTELRNHFRNLIQDDSPMVRRSTGNSLVDFIDIIDEDHLKSEFVPIFDNLAHDDQDSVRTLAVDVGIAIARKFKDFEIYEFLMKTFKQLGEDESWRVRQRVAWRIPEIPISDKTRDEIVNIFRRCVRDDEAEVRVFAGKNLYNFTHNFLESYKQQQENYEDIFEKNFEEVIAPEIYLLMRDPNDDVRVALSTNILSLSAVLRKECFNANIFPLVIDALENEEYMPFKENMLKNLNWLPMDLDITKSVKSISNVIHNMIQNSQLHWRTRRNLLLAFMHITKNTTSDYFDENLKFFYQFLLTDPIYAIRRTAPLILPLLVKQFGMTWAKTSLIPIFVPFSTDHRYLFRYTTLFAIEELISPTLDNESDGDKNGKYLADFKNLIGESKVLETLVKIVKLSNRLDEELKSDETLEEPDDYLSYNDLKFYAEDTLENLKKEQKLVIFSTGLDEINDCYLEGVLLMLVKEFVKVVKDLGEDPIKNVEERARRTLRSIKSFNREIKKEVEQEWVQDALKGVIEEDLKRIEDEIEEKLKKEERLDELERLKEKVEEKLKKEQERLEGLKRLEDKVGERLKKEEGVEEIENIDFDMAESEEESESEEAVEAENIED
jgi:serine/threonine-protein phosphatase 2A regulatory subunit A